MFGFSTFSYDDEGYRTCSVTGLQIHRSAEDMVKLFGLTAIVALLIGGLFAIFVALTRWELVGLLAPADFYTFLSIHAWNLLIFWMIFMEIAVLYVGGPYVLGRPLSLPRVAKAGYALMLGGAVLINVAIWLTKQPNQAPLLTSYAPLPSSPWFYLGVVVFLAGALVAALPFLATIWHEKRENPGGTLPLVAFGAFITSIVAAEAIVGGLITYVPTFLWRVGMLAHIDAAWYRQMYWIVGHGSQQINLLAMISVWYFMTHVVGGAEVASEKVSRSAFVLYLFFINMGAAHHLMSDPGVSAAWRLWNTSYSAYGAVVASMIHAFAIPAGLEIGRRKRGEGGGTFGWLWSAPWKDPGFSATILSIILFGFLGGITGVMMGQMQLNMTWHNTLATVGHFHATVATGTTLAFMGLGYYVLRLVFGREWIARPIATIQPYLYGGAMGITSLMMMYLGILYGIPRRHPSVMDIPGTEFSFAAARPLFVIFGVMALISIIGGALFVLVAVGSLLAGDRYQGGLPVTRPTAVADGGGHKDTAHHLLSMRGTFILTSIFLGVFVVMWALNWYLLSQLWQVG
ncbi:cytochrome c oxidase subunit I [Haloplanus aerogenes]|uniref:Cytochrome C oxidase subunit I n=1 Tax=Haloplanus aerogenes TaxID=660522 RepID=A0A3M0DCL3_9EURY|nr:cbb3-type cytochrome c oxidase subunit I [Haloplanus aerogenes]AZH27024.1 cytochrome C oxidase subunit I [Haloplanus aerogenes]RMB13483.1 cytochrome c oxidase subunit 1 [Haloplanus aerogenes]